MRIALISDIHGNFVALKAVLAANDHLRITLCQVSLDVEAVKQAALNSDMPHAGWWAQEWKQS